MASGCDVLQSGYSEAPVCSVGKWGILLPSRMILQGLYFGDNDFLIPSQEPVKLLTHPARVA